MSLHAQALNLAQPLIGAVLPVFWTIFSGLCDANQCQRRFWWLLLGIYMPWKRVLDNIRACVGVLVGRVACPSAAACSHGKCLFCFCGFGLDVDVWLFSDARSWFAWAQLIQDMLLVAVFVSIPQNCAFLFACFV